VIEIDAALGWSAPDLGPASWLYVVALLPPQLAVLVRRVHDTGRPTVAAFLPALVIAVAGLVLAGATEMFGRDGEAGWQALRVLWFVAAAALAISVPLLIWWLASPSQPGPNRFGPEPAA
jgi:uncharacterized membrane protein YhaH (DUF805 family)